MIVKVGPTFTGKYTVGGVLGYTNQNFYPTRIFVSMLGVETREWSELHNEDVHV
jgi:hypothetical protein